MTSRGNKNGASPEGARHGARPRVVIIVVVLSCVAAIVVLRPKKSAPNSATAPQEPSQTAPAVPTKVASAGSQADESLPIQVSNESAASPTLGRATVQKRVAAEPVAAPRPEPSPYTRQLVNNLVNLGQDGVPKTPEQINAWRQNLQQLVQQGASALPAIQEFLDKNMDLVFGAEGARGLGYGSARGAMFDAMLQIGGTEGANAMMGVMQGTADPREIAQLAKNLDQLAPEQYRGQILEAARQVLAMSGDAAKANQTDVAPLFEVLGKYGGPGAVAEIEQAGNNYKYYSAITLAQLADGAGVPALIQMVQDTGGGPVKNISALQMLTQAAGQNADARAALVQAVKANNISPSSWAYLAPLLSGDQVQFQDSALGNSTMPANKSDVRTFHIAAGNQNFYTAPGTLNADQLQQQLAFINELLGVASNPTAVQTLQATKDTLSRRLQQLGASPRGDGGNASSQWPNQLPV